MRIALTILLVVLGAFLLFWRLDGAQLWRDEGTTANWARMMAENGTWLPWVFDGEQLVVQAPDGHDVNSKLLPAMHTYLQFYVAAASFKLLGADTFSARFPFALLGAVTLFVLYRLGVVLFGRGLTPFLLPFLGLPSIYFLNAARQCRYYILVILLATWLLLEFCRYLRKPELAGQRAFYVRVGVAGVLLYFSNYVSFAGMWASLGIFVLLLRDWQLIRGFVLLSAGLAAVLGVEFWLLHADFAAAWPPPDERSLADLYRIGLINRGRDFWRMIPLVVLLPAALYLFVRESTERSLPAKVALAFAVLIVWSPIVFAFGSRMVRQQPAQLFWAGVALCLLVPAALFYSWTKCERRLPVQAALLGGLVLLISPSLAIAAGKNMAAFRHYYQILPAAVMLGALATVALARRKNRVPASACFAALLIWPNLDFWLGNENVVERQFFADDSHNAPLAEYLRENVRPGETVAFFRNVKGMAIYFYFPRMNWVALLDSDAPHNQQFRGRIPDHQFDDYPGVDWYVIWNPRGRMPKKLSDDHVQVWEYSYFIQRSWWDRPRPPAKRTYEVYYRPRAERRLPRETARSNPRASGPG